MGEKILNVLSGCSGIGGLDLGFKQEGFRTVCYIENANYPNQLLLERMHEGLLDIAPIFKDFKRFDGRAWRGVVDCFIAGIPCQPHSKAGKRRGAEDSRNLWPDMARIIAEMEPKYVVVENVEGLYSGKDAYGTVIASELYKLGYVVVVGYISAAQIGAAHERMRTFTIGILADTKHGRCIYKQSEKYTAKRGKPSFCNVEPDGAKVSNSDYCGCKEFEQSINKESTHTRTMQSSGWKIEPSVGRVVDGVPAWVDRIKALGNAVVPQVAQEVAKFIKEIDSASFV